MSFYTLVSAGQKCRIYLTKFWCQIQRLQLEQSNLNIGNGVKKIDTMRNEYSKIG